MPPRFPPSPIFSLLHEPFEHRLAESVSEDLDLSSILDESTIESLRGMKLGYGSATGDPRLRECIAGLLDVDADDILVTNGAAGGLFTAIFGLVGPGDEVVVSVPNFPPNIDLVGAAGATVKTVPRRFDERYRVDPDRIAAALTPATRLVVLVSPHNPSGVCVRRAELEAIVAAMRERCPRARVLVDETYRLATHGEDVPAASAANLGPRVLTTASLSKCHGAPGLRVGWLSCTDPELRELLLRVKNNTVINVSTVDECLALRVLDDASILRKRAERLARGLERVTLWAERNRAAIEWVRPDAGAMACVRLRPDRFDDAGVERCYAAMKERSIQVAPGGWFRDEARVFRLGFGATSIEALDAGLSAIEAILG